MVNGILESRIGELEQAVQSGFWGMTQVPLCVVNKRFAEIVAHIEQSQHPVDPALLHRVEACNHRLEEIRDMEYAWYQTEWGWIAEKISAFLNGCLFCSYAKAVPSAVLLGVNIGKMEGEIPPENSPGWFFDSWKNLSKQEKQKAKEDLSNMARGNAWRQSLGFYVVSTASPELDRVKIFKDLVAVACVQDRESIFFYLVQLYCGLDEGVRGNFLRRLHRVSQSCTDEELLKIIEQNIE